MTAENIKRGLVEERIHRLFDAADPVGQSVWY